MKISTKTMYVNKFFRAFPEEFTVTEFIRYMSYVDCKITKKEAEDLIAASPYIFSTCCTAVSLSIADFVITPNPATTGNVNLVVNLFPKLSTLLEIVSISFPKFVK